MYAQEIFSYVLCHYCFALPVELISLILETLASMKIEKMKKKLKFRLAHLRDAYVTACRTGKTEY